MKREIELSVVIPCLNESETIQICLEKIFKVFNDENFIISKKNGYQITWIKD